MQTFSKLKKTILLSALVFLAQLSLMAQWSSLGNALIGENESDLYGRSMSLSGDGSTVAVGLYDDLVYGNSKGNVKIFSQNNSQWQQIGVDIEGRAVGDNFGFCLSLNNTGNIVAIGAPGNYVGHAAIYSFNGSEWEQLGEDIDGDHSGDYFGYTISMNNEGNRVAIGALKNGTGYAKIYDFDGSTWNLLGSQIPGYVTALSKDGSTVIIGLPNNDDAAANAGKVKVYRLINNSWTPMGSDINGDAEYDQFGSVVKIDGDGSNIIVGCPKNNTNGTDAGQVKVFSFLNDDWQQKGNDIYGASEDNLLGQSVSISENGETIAIGEPSYLQGVIHLGRVQVFSFNNTDWTLKGEAIIGNGYWDDFGESIGLSNSGDLLAIGAPYYDADSGYNNGKVASYIWGANSIAEFDKSRLQLWPNPTNRFINVQIDNKLDKIECYSMQGKLLKSTYGNHLDVQDLTNGLYLIKVYSDKGIYSSSFIKE